MGVDGKAILALREDPEPQVPVHIEFSHVSLQLGVKSNVTITVTGNSLVENWALILLHYDGQDATQALNLTKVTDIETGFGLVPPTVNQSTSTMLPVGTRQAPPPPPPSRTIQNIPVYLVGANGTTPASPALQSLLFCIGPLTTDNQHNICDFYSETFNLSPDPNAAQTDIQGQATQQPTFALAVPSPSTIPSSLLTSSMTITATAKAPQLTIFTTSLAPTPISTFIATTVTSIPTSVETAEVTETPFTTNNPKSKSSLSTGAKIGIALGSLFFISLILLIALFLLRKKHAKRSTSSSSQPEQVLLTKNMHTDSFTNAQNILLEKERNASSTITPHNGIDTPTQEISPSASTIAVAKQQQRHSALSPYETLPSAPYTGSISPQRRVSPPTTTMTTEGIAGAFPMPPSTPPQNHAQKHTQTQTQNTTAAGVTNISPSHSHSHSPTPSPTSSTPPASASTPTFETYQAFQAYHDIDIPLYGDARHSPQIFTTHPHERERGIESPFLREEMEGMTAEEIARLEEEERRIDAAIAAAEARSAEARRS